MSSIKFNLPSSPPVIEDNVFYEEIIIWIYSGLFMLILPLIMSYYYYALYKLRFLMALRRRHFQLLTFLYIVILIDFICIEPIRLLCGTYLPTIDILYWIYLILSTFSTQIIVYTVLLKIWLLFYDIKWINVSIINDNQWRYHINNPLHERENKNISKKNDNMTRKKNKQQYGEEEEEKGNVEHFDNNIQQNIDMSWFVKHRQSFGNIQYIYKYFVIIVFLSVVISLLSKCFFHQTINEIIMNALILIPIIIIYILWLYTPQFNDIFSLRKEIKYLLIYGICCVVMNTIIDAFIFANQNNVKYWIQLELALTFIYHLVVFGIFIFFVCYPIKTMSGLYGNAIYGTLDDQHDDDRTQSIVINKDKVSYYWCLCCVSLKFIKKISVFDAKLTGVNHTISAKESMNLQMVASSSNNPSNNPQAKNELGLGLGRQIEMTQKHKKQKTDKYPFNNIAGIDDDESNSFEFNRDEKQEKQEAEEYIGGKTGSVSLEQGENVSGVKFVPIKPGKKIEPKQNHVSIEMNRKIKSFDNKFKLLESNQGLELFMKHCSREFSMENILAIIELNQYQIYCKQQEKYILKQRELRKKSAKKRYKKKKESIRKLKLHKNEEIKNKKEKLKLMSRESLTSNKIDDNNGDFKNNLMMTQSARKKRHSLKKRRKERIKQSNLEQDIIDDDDLILDEIASKPPIDTRVSNILDYEHEHFSDNSDQPMEEHKSEHKSEHKHDESYSDFNLDGNAADDEEDGSDNILVDTSGAIEQWNNFLNINEKLDNLPESTIINKPFVVNSKNKRIKQLELICIELSKKYILSQSQFQLNLPKYIIKDIINKINEMKEKHINFKNNIKSKQHIISNSTEYNSDESDINMPSVHQLQLTQSESNYSNWYPQYYENQLHAFFDHIIAHILNLIDDSFYRLKKTDKYKQFINEKD